MKTIPLTNGQEAIVDDEDHVTLAQYTWHARRCEGSNTEYAVRCSPFGGSVYMHREILRLEPGEFTDHVNGNGLDNRRRNLRKCNRSQNAFNSQLRRRGCSKYRGVTFNRKSLKNPWRAVITVNQKPIYLGAFDSAERAAKAYDRAARKHAGPFARLNFPS